MRKAFPLIFIMSSSSSTGPHEVKSIFIKRCDTRSLPWDNALDEAANEDAARTFISDAFHVKNIGRVKQVDLKKKHTHTGHVFYIAFVYFDHWYENPTARSLQEDLMTPEKVCFHYHAKWFWVLEINSSHTRPLPPLHPPHPPMHPPHPPLPPMPYVAGHEEQMIRMQLDHAQTITKYTNMLIERDNQIRKLIDTVTLMTSKMGEMQAPSPEETHAAEK